MFKEVCDLLKPVKTRTTPYRPSVNGQVKRMNHTILQTLRCFIQGQQEDWDLHMSTVGRAIRSNVNRSTGFTPNFLMLGREVLQHIDLMRYPGVKKNEELMGDMLHDIRKPRGLLIEMPGRNYSNLNDARKGL